MTVVPHDGLAPCPPADPEPRAPRFSVPPLSCDCHIHVFEGERYPYAARRGYTPPDAPLSRLLQLHRTLGIERAVLTQASVHGSDNRAVLEGSSSDPQRFRAVVAIDGSVKDSELRRMHEAGARGIRVNLVALGGAKRIVVGQLAGEGQVKVYSSGSALDGGPAMYLQSPSHSHRPEFREVASFAPFDGASDTKVATTSTTSGANLLVSASSQRDQTARIIKYELVRLPNQARALQAIRVAEVLQFESGRSAALGGD